MSTPKTPPKTLTVLPVDGERYVFNVESANGIEYYRVDLTSVPLIVRSDGQTVLNTFNGICDCPHFQHRLSTMARQGYIARCKHILAVRDYFLDSIFHEYLRLEQAAARRAEQAP